MKKKKIKKGVNVTVSPKAYKKISREAKNALPMRNLRQQVNFINNISLEE